MEKKHHLVPVEFGLAEQMIADLEKLGYAVVLEDGVYYLVEQVAM